MTASHFHNEEAAFAYVETHLWREGPVCPFCKTSERIARLRGHTSRMGLHKCYVCRKTFTVRIGSIFEDSHFPLHLWLQAIQLICGSKQGISTRQIQRTFNCSMKTACFLTRRIREIMKPGAGGSPAPLVSAILGNLNCPSARTNEPSAQADRAEGLNCTQRAVQILQLRKTA